MVSQGERSGAISAEDLIPHRPPFLWIDRVVELEAGLRCVALKYIDPSEPLFTGHFPGDAIFPGALVIEAAAQTAAAMQAAFGSGQKSRRYRLAAVNRFKFLAPVLPGVELRIETRKTAEMGSMTYVEATATVGGEIVAKGELSVAAVDASGMNPKGE